MDVDDTLAYYEENTQAFCKLTLTVDLSQIQDRFLSYLPEGGNILDFGCGTGRDTKYFLSQGYVVDAIDGSEKLCKFASALTGIEVRHECFEDLEAVNVYDGIWACASILHLCRKELPAVLRKMEDALKPDGVIYASFPLGDSEGERSGRYFTDFTDESLREMISNVDGLKVMETWTSHDARLKREDDLWLNCLLCHR